MQTLLLWVGKTNDSRLKSLIEDYAQRINRYQPLEMLTLPELKIKGKLPETIQKEKEGKLILEKNKKGDYVILLDEKGK